ncbi:hypothetical protein LTR56_025745 [Elasticomyces elasticus]|nr:hypothetical protein LTR56_025745 [Elasticomyces elasticus]KAK3657652.1 hypothetical protein LTR22_009204 [Elasticomyces elasticus]KAK4922458.1 hypothetical protein LTR49_010158 [Elasticomyces elasticus]KAK5760545.1 hypothetical protein LTS12_009254 [Elasticomyces elasticus]
MANWLKPILSTLLLFFLCITATYATTSTYSQQVCATKQTTKKPASVPTTTIAKTLSFQHKVTITSTPTKSVTPLPTTITVVSTATSFFTSVVSQQTDTFMTTIVVSQTSTVSETITGTEFTTSTAFFTTSVTTTVSASPGFTALGDALAAQGLSWAKRKQRRAADHRMADRALEQRATLDKRTWPPTSSVYPAAVTCYKVVEIVSTSTKTATAQATTVTAPPSTATQTSTTTITSTRVATYPIASTTVSIQSTTLITSTAIGTATITSTLTSTSTVFAPEATYYPTCQSNNIVADIAQGALYYTEISIGSTTDSTSATDCCIQCLTFPGCSGTIYNELGRCFLFANTICDASQVIGSLWTWPGPIYLRASNSNCGQWSYGGKDDP